MGNWTSAAFDSETPGLAPQRFRPNGPVSGNPVSQDWRRIFQRKGRPILDLSGDS